MTAAASVWFAALTGGCCAFIGYWYGVGRTERIWKARLRANRQTFLYLLARQAGQLTAAERAQFDQLVSAMKETS